mgnify:CR=1 FL=1
MGAGGHGAVVADVLAAMRRAGADVQPAGFVDDRLPAGSTAHGLPVFGHSSTLSSVPHDAIVIALGDNRTRASLYAAWSAAGERLVSAVHPSAVIAPDTAVGPGSMICAGVVVNPGTVIGPNAIVNTASSLDHHNQIGAHVHVAPGVHTGGDVAIGEGTLVGLGAIVLPRRTVGAWAVVGAGAVVVRDVVPGTTVVGVPATEVTK